MTDGGTTWRAGGHASGAHPPSGAGGPSATTHSSGGGRAAVWRRLVAQSGAELSLTLRRGESLLLTIAIPVVLLAFLSEVHLLPTGPGAPVDFLAPGILALAVMSTALVNLSIATGFERGYGVLKRLGTTPLGRGTLLGAKIVAIVVVELLQAIVLVAVALAVGWHPSTAGTGQAVVVVLLATAGFGGIGLLLAGVLRPEVNLAAANGLWLVLLLVSGMLAPLSKLPIGLADAARALPAAALAAALHGALDGGTVAGWSWLVLAVWAVLGPALAARWFRWE